MITKIVKYGADWCGPCKTLDKTLDKLEGVVVEKYDIDEVDEEVILKLEIKNIPRMFFYNDKDEIVDTTVGAISLNEIKEIIAKHGTE